LSWQVLAELEKHRDTITGNKASTAGSAKQPPPPTRQLQPPKAMKTSKEATVKEEV
jgi:hypothetical protein